MDDNIVFDASKKKKGQKGGIASSPKPSDPTPQLSQNDEQFAEKIGEEAGIIRATRENIENTKVDQKERGKKEAEKEEAEEVEHKKEESNMKFEGLLSKTGEILLQFQTAFPFDPFPDRVTIDMNKITISKREFFSSEIVTSITIKEVKDVSLSLAGFLGTLTIETTSSEPIVISKVKKQDALKARRVLQALIMTERENIQLTKVKTDNLVEKLETIGKVVQP